MLCCAVWSELEGTSRAAWQKTLDDVGRKLRGKFAERMPVKPGQKTLAHIEKCHFILKDQQVSKKKKKISRFLSVSLLALKWHLPQGYKSLSELLFECSQPGLLDSAEHGMQEGAWHTESTLHPRHRDWDP